MVPTATLVRLMIGAAFAFALPVALLVWWRRTRRARLAPFFVGAAVFAVFALGLETLAHRVFIFGDNAVSHAVNASAVLYMLYGGFAAGLFEETGRYVAFRRLLPARRYPGRDTAVTYGIGHGGIEAMLTLGVTYAGLTVLALCLRRGDQSAALAMMGGDAGVLSAQIAALGQLTPGTVLLAMLERGAAMILHIALSVFVFLAARDRTRRKCFPAAVILHAVADMPAALYQRGLLPLGIVEVWGWLIALLALYAARKCYLEQMDP